MTKDLSKTLCELARIEPVFYRYVPTIIGVIATGFTKEECIENAIAWFAKSNTCNGNEIIKDYYIEERKLNFKTPENFVKLQNTLWALCYPSTSEIFEAKGDCFTVKFIQAFITIYEDLFTNDYKHNIKQALQQTEWVY